MNVIEYNGAKYVLRETPEGYSNSACRSCAFGECINKAGFTVYGCTARNDDTISCIREAVRQDLTPSRAYFQRID